MTGNSRFRIDPNPPIAGQSAEVTYIGPACEVDYVVEHGETITVVPDANGTFQIDPVPDADELMLTDRLGLPGFLYVEIVEAN